MSKKEVKTLVPKLRFPEFQKVGEWTIAPLKKLASRRTERNRDGGVTHVLTNSAEHGVVNQRDYFDKDIATQGNLENYFIIDLGDYVYNPRISKFAPVGPISKNEVAKGVMSPLYTVFRFKNPDNEFYAHYFNSHAWHSYMRQVGSTGARHDRMAISNDDFMALPLPVAVPKEQQKIADCLSSVDELITTQAQKIDALKAHKKGLMQQLFPSEGESVPKLRFPEFREAGVWDESILGNHCIIKTGKLDANAMVENGQYRFYTCAKDYYFIDVYAFDTDALLISGNGANVGYVHHYNGKFNAYQRTYVLDKFSEEIVFIKYYLEENLHRRIATEKNDGNTPYIIMSTLTEMEIKLPEKGEQKKIADCLSLIDELVSEQTQKLDALKAHKKGLMQQLFPSPDEVNG